MNKVDEKLYHYVKYVDPFAQLEDMEELFMINDFDLFMKFKNGKKAVFDTFEYTSTAMRYGTNDLTDEQYKKEFSVILRKLMRRRFVSQEELAKRVGTTQQMISRYVNGDSFPSFPMMIKLAKALRCTVDDFYYKYF